MRTLSGSTYTLGLIDGDQPWFVIEACSLAAHFILCIFEYGAECSAESGAK